MEHPAGKEAVGFVIRGQDNEFGADSLSLVKGDTPGNSHILGGIAGTGHNAPLSTSNDRFSSQLRMNNLFAGGKEGISVNMHNGSWPGMKAEKDIVHDDPS